MYISQVPVNGFVSSQSIEHSKKEFKKGCHLDNHMMPMNFESS